MKHTPGPWAARYVMEGMPTGCVPFGVIGPEGKETARVWKEEDVRLIAAAPDMLDMLEEMEWLKDVLCMTCGEFKFDGHTADCRLGNLLAKIRKE